MKDKLIFLFYPFLSLFILISCEPSPSGGANTQEIDSSDPFFVDDASHLYFKNMRAYYYDVEPGPQAEQRIDLYQLKRFEKTDGRPILYPVIVDHWMQDKAYLFLEPNEYSGGFQEPLTIFKLEAGDTSYLSTQDPRPAGKLALAQEIGKALQAEQALFVLDETGRPLPLFEDRYDQTYFMTTLKDYQRLIQQEQ